MLQVASGKLFTREPGQRNELRGVLYTNLYVNDRTIETAAGRLLSTGSMYDPKTLVYEITELVEDEPRRGAIVSHTITPYLSDFAAVVSFSLNVTCTPDPDLTSRLLSGRPGPLVGYPPNKMIQRVFDGLVWCQPDDESHLVDLINQLIGLERKSFLVAMRAIRSYVTGLHRLADDYDLAYTLLVVSIESLAQEFDGDQPEWGDYDKQKRHAIDSALAEADEVIADRIRKALLEIEHVSLASRFRAFALDHLRPSFFREEAHGLISPVGRADTIGALRQAYNLRSKYIHELAELPDILTISGISGLRDTTQKNRQVMLTFQGLARLARHVITTFIQRQQKVAREEYDYRDELSGIVSLEVAPQYWIGRAETLNSNVGRRRLEAFLGQVTSWLLGKPDAAVTDLQDMLTPG